MISKPMDVLHNFPVRKSKKQKQAFRDAVESYVKTLGYESTIEKGSMGVRNIVIGNPENAQYLITAHYDTPAQMLIPNLITPCNFWTFLGYQFLIIIPMLLPPFILALLLLLLGVDREIVGPICGLSMYAMVGLLLFGPANRNNANDNTSGVVSVLEIAKSLPEAYRSKVCFVLFDLEEAGLLGSSAYRNAHKKQSENQIVLNMDCVGDGNEIVMFPTKKLKTDSAKMDILRRICGKFGDKSIALREKGFAYYPSDQNNFPYGVGIGAFRRNKHNILYYSRIHTRKDTVLEGTNVNILRAAIVSLITCSAAK